MSALSQQFFTMITRLFQHHRRATRKPAERLLFCFSAAIALMFFFPFRQASAGVITFPNVPGASLDLSFGTTQSGPRDSAVGQRLTYVSKNVGVATSDRSCQITEALTVNGMPAPGIPGVYQTNLTGVGVRFYRTEYWRYGWIQAPVTMTYTPPNETNDSFIRADLVVTGPIQSGVLTSLPTMTVQFSGSCISTLTRTVTITAGTRVSAGACTVTTPNTRVPLPPVRSTSLRPVGTVSTERANFNIGLSCPAGVGVYVTMTDATNPGNRTNNLALAPGSTAQGVALRLSSGGTPVTFGADSAVAGNPGQWYVGPSATTTSVPLTAQYVSVGTVVPGSVNALATFTLSYQ